MKIRLLIFTALFFVLQGCSQEKKDVMITQNPEINANNIVDKLTQQVQHYEIEPVYFITYDISWCFAEILVNDIPVFKNFTKPLTSSVFSINHAIFKSGIQKVTYRLYPLGKIEGDDEVYRTLKDNSKIELSIDIADNVTKQDIKFIKAYSSPLITNPDRKAYEKEVFAGTGKTFYEDSFTFEAEVPYTLKGWSKSQDLRKLNPKELEKKVLQAYNNSHKIFQNKDLDGIARLNYNGMKIQFLSEYAHRDEIEFGWKDLLETIQNPTFKMQPIENYKMVFYADGRLVALVQNTKEPLRKGMSALWAKFKIGKSELGYENYNMLHLPYGKSELEVAR